MEKIEETELSISKAWDKIAEGYPLSPNDVAHICGSVMDAMNCGKEVHVIEGKACIGKLKKDKVKVPQDVADLIESYRKEGVVLRNILDSWRFLSVAEEDDSINDSEYDTKTVKWILNNPEKFLLAWLQGYEVESLLFVINQNNEYFKSFNKDMTWNPVVPKNEAFVFQNKKQADLIARFIGGKVETIENDR